MDNAHPQPAHVTPGSRQPEQESRSNPVIRTTPARLSPAERAICLLYAFFFLFWCAGLLLGLRQGPPVLLLGLPLWFIISCFLAFVAACCGLILLSKRHFQ